MKFSIFLSLASILASSAEYLRGNDPLQDDTPPCCQGPCETEGHEKYYSVDKSHNMCGECCMDPKDYNKYHLFEPGLTKADGTNTPCADIKYGSYKETVTHGFLSIKMTLDLYKPTEE